MKKFTSIFLAIILSLTSQYAHAAKIEYTVKNGDNLYILSKKILNPEQRASLLNDLEKSKQKIILKPKDKIIFEVENNKVIKLEYGNGLNRKKSPDVHERLITVKPGDSIMKIAEKEKLPQAIKAELLAKAKQLKKIKPNDQLSIKWTGNKLTELSSAKAQPKSKSQTFSTKNLTNIETTTQNDYKMLSIKIRNNFYHDAKKAGLPANVTTFISDLYKKNEKTSKLLTSGSTLQVVYKPGEKNFAVAYSRISKGKQTHEAIRYNNNHSTEYYDQNGKPYQQGFLRMPLGAHRLSSSFSLGRKHPILGRVRPHYGVDLSAKRGAPVWSTAAGTVIFAGYQKGFGRTIKVQHSPSVTTLYAHLSKLESGIKVGSKVSQKQIIGYVGSSGLSTGPHLHYEYHINNQPRDPMTVALTSGKPLAKPERISMLAQRKQWLAMADSAPQA